MVRDPAELLTELSKSAMADNGSRTFTQAEMKALLAEAEAKAARERAAERAETEAKAAEERAKAAVRTYTLYVLQRHRITCNSTRVCRSCKAWHSTHLEDFGY